MANKPEWLLDYQNNHYSQSGEDGVIKKILEILPETNNWCVEFGAWDGIYLSNVRSLIESSGYSSVLIEGSKKKFKTLKKNYQKYNNVYPLNNYVGFSEDDNLDVILANTKIPLDFDFLSIDVDGNDYHIWKSTTKYTPKVVCIEYNPTIPTEVDFVQEPNPNISQGSSLSALVKLGQYKGYELISVLKWNAFFVKKEYFPLFEIYDNSPATLRKSLDMITYLFVGFDGKVFLQGSKKLYWHNIMFSEKDIKVLPKILQKAPVNYGLIEKILFHIYKLRRGV